jgi:hypothetical protein
VKKQHVGGSLLCWFSVQTPLIVVCDNRKPNVSDNQMSHGFRFCAMIGPHIPESVIQHHNEFHPGPREALPRYGTHDQGIWLPEVRSGVNGNDLPRTSPIDDIPRLSDSES